MLLKIAVRASKYEDPLESVKELHVNPQYARVQQPNVKEMTVPLGHPTPLAEVLEQLEGEVRSPGRLFGVYHS